MKQKIIYTGVAIASLLLIGTFILMYLNYKTMHQGNDNADKFSATQHFINSSGTMYELCINDVEKQYNASYDSNCTYRNDGQCSITPYIVEVLHKRRAEKENLCLQKYEIEMKTIDTLCI